MAATSPLMSRQSSESCLDIAPCSNPNKPRRMARYSDEKSTSEKVEETPLVVEQPAESIPLPEEKSEDEMAEDEDSEVSNKKRFRFREDSMEESLDEEDIENFEEVDEAFEFNMFETYEKGQHGLIKKMESGKQIGNSLKVVMEEFDDLGFDPATCKRPAKPLKRFCYRQ